MMKEELDPAQEIGDLFGDVPTNMTVVKSLPFGRSIPWILRSCASHRIVHYEDNSLQDERITVLSPLNGFAIKT
ncbi:hypothetical protein C6341_g9368 [Phytophthora cactorum]|nr:hypothetical protein PC122_g8037 [Phytophthora cactorum]KAG3175646.1 hypothetical protein C6341_g9368 [Phytophthora cactorum]